MNVMQLTQTILHPMFRRRAACMMYSLLQNPIRLYVDGLRYKPDPLLEENDTDEDAIFEGAVNEIADGLADLPIQYGTVNLSGYWCERAPDVSAYVCLPKKSEPNVSRRVTKTEQDVGPQNEKPDEYDPDGEAELTRDQLERQDFVDNAIQELLQLLNPTETPIPWDIESISRVRDEIQRCVVSKTGCTEQQFYPCFCEQQVDSTLHAV
jgi:hypothetical protein